MKPQEVKVTFQPSGRTVYVLPETVLLEAAARAGLILQTPCGGHGTCGKCRVRVPGEGCTLGDASRAALSEEALAEGYRLACQERVVSDTVVEIPAESLFEHAQQILTSDTGEAAEFDPVVRKLAFELAAPDQQNPAPDLARLRGALGDCAVGPDLVRRLPAFLRKNDWRGTAVLARNTAGIPARGLQNLLALEPGDSTAALCGVAFDIGTTTIVGTLIDLSDGRELAVEAALNPQIALGDDVVSRIKYARENPGGLGELQKPVIGTVNKIIERLVQQAGVRSRDIYELVVVGNVTMQQILCGYDPSALGELPFVPVYDTGQRLPAMGLGIKANPTAALYVFPQIGGFVGGDTLAGMLACRLDRRDAPYLLVDIGTNGEIVLAHKDRLLATSTAAGPAFEGARIAQGMRATTGAIEKVVIRDGAVRINVVGNVAPTGLCGTALLDTAAELLRAGILDVTGRILPPDELPEGVPESLRGRLEENDGQIDFVLVAKQEFGNEDAVYLRQKDVRELQLATGAIRAGIRILLARVGLEPDDIARVLLAGGFGNFIRRSNARRIGLLPPIASDRIRFVGNAASLGAKLALLSVAERESAEALREKTEHVDLSLDPGFQMAFGEAMLFPETERLG